MPLNEYPTVNSWTTSDYLLARTLANYKSVSKKARIAYVEDCSNSRAGSTESPLRSNYHETWTAGVAANRNSGGSATNLFCECYWEALGWVGTASIPVNAPTQNIFTGV
ncbi:hypothetical protein MHY01S_22290 [Meiothermus hypogaeus NBRC 106114]|uniref:Uncharacterized protein n=1 Tax=Meiothermus hypogaeus NBRC 106114 TaxID=1227553 RepID=A0A511R374_9DEIN|nr:hypothetical protein MHY01S_22290 [Meiothermus hypogaeus NBRC 106114]